METGSCRSFLHSRHTVEVNFELKIIISKVGAGIADFGVKKIRRKAVKRYTVEPNTHYNFYKTLDGEFVAFRLFE